MSIGSALKNLLTPLAVVLAIAAALTLDYLGIIDLAAWRLPSSPETDRLVSDLPIILVAFLFGALGAFIRAPNGSASWGQRMRRLGIGGAIGVIVFVVLESRVIPLILYQNLPAQGLEISFYGLALLAIFAGMYAAELTGWAQRH